MTIAIQLRTRLLYVYSQLLLYYPKDTESIGRISKAISSALEKFDPFRFSTNSHARCSLQKCLFLHTS